MVTTLHTAMLTQTCRGLTVVAACARDLMEMNKQFDAKDTLKEEQSWKGAISVRKYVMAITLPTAMHTQICRGITVVATGARHQNKRFDAKDTPYKERFRKGVISVRDPFVAVTTWLTATHTQTCRKLSVVESVQQSNTLWHAKIITMFGGSRMDLISAIMGMNFPLLQQDVLESRCKSRSLTETALQLARRTINALDLSWIPQIRAHSILKSTPSIQTTTPPVTSNTTRKHDCFKLPVTSSLDLTLVGCNQYLSGKTLSLA